VRAFDTPLGKELRIRRGGIFLPLEDWIDENASAGEKFEENVVPDAAIHLPNPYAHM